jgi:nicotinate phosphoribosyltransferase
VACGLERCLDFLESFGFTDEDLDYLAETQRYPSDTLEAFRRLRFTGNVWAIPEGRLVFPDEPLLEVTAPLPEAQLMETYLLNQVTYQTAIASKAARCRIAAPDKVMVDFAFRRVHGVEASIAVARATAMVGFTATSNVEAARLLGLPATGTMAHSYIEAFETEAEAFRAYAKDYPDRVVLLVDTYDTLQGVEKAIEVAKELRAKGQALTAIRLDSGDLASLAQQSRKLLDDAGLHDVQIFASGGLDENVIASLAGAPIDSFGVGTRVGVAADAPFLDSVYKLVEYDGHRVAKLSTAKATLPGPKQVWRRPGFQGDIIGLREEVAPDGAEPLLEPVMAGGQRHAEEDLSEARERFASELGALPDTLRSLDPGDYAVEHTAALRELSEQVRDEIIHRELR